MLFLNSFAQSRFSFQYFVPHMVFGRSGDTFVTTTFVVVNLSTRPVQGWVTAYTSTGDLMKAFGISWPVVSIRPIAEQGFISPPLGQRFVSTRTTFLSDETEFQVGWAEIVSDGAIGIVVQLTWSKAGRIITTTSLLPDPLTTNFSTYAQVSLSSATGVALLNPSSVPTQVRIAIYDSEGNFLDQRRIILPPKNKIAQFLNEGELFTELQLLQGSVEVSSPVPLAATAILVTENYWSTYRILPARLDE